MALSSLESQLRMHIRVLYVLIVSLLVVLLAGTWITQNQLKHLQDSNTHGIVSKREVIEFRLVEDDDTNDVKIEPISPSQRSARKKNHSHVVGFYKSQLKSGKVHDYNNGTAKKSDKKSSAKSRRKRQVDSAGNEEDFDLTKYVWLTSYSRISVNTMNKFCRKTKDYCEPMKVGAPGTPGEPGRPGRPGDRGDKGDLGLRGLPGNTGTKGEKGDKGNAGLRGIPGENGRHGIRGVSGPEGPSGTKGDTGDMGPPGPIGHKGDQGNMGRPGIPGKSGKDGHPGTAGVPGEKGEKGMEGRRGLVGFIGGKGDRGLPGKQGPPGIPGTAGKDGIDGMPGPRGEPGRNWTSSFLGKRGKNNDIMDNIPGLRGPTGPPGPPGPPGVPGMKGDKGDVGKPPKCTCAAGLRGEPESVPILPPTTVQPTPPIPPRVRECAIKVFGKPVHQRFTNHSVGAWMQDSRGNRQKYWYAPDFNGNSIYEYRDRNHYKNNIPDRKYDLGSISYQGVGHMVFKGSFYFHLANSSSVARYKLSDGTVTILNITDAIYEGDRPLYSFENNYFDFAIDDNGIWVVYGMNVSKDMLGILKLRPDTLQVLKKWELPIKHQSYGNAFIVCGVLYLVQSVTKPKTKVELAYDLYEDKKLCHQLAFSNPFGKNYMLAFYNKKIYGYDNGNEIMYPVLMLNQKELDTIKSKSKC